ncbi:hypothetical protein CHU92_09320 [Flavobacterium cyanobacteriorum]|uniref:DUF6194 domain-containing protein n=2 Tax=Flavobacterium TaxID=237 RepID=A0A255Z5B1_9FLAO|nr:MULTISPECIES: DUF6194 family protein [Flavobacterium]MBM6498034.1 hypothetical protein [Flavobacterium macrobrachii]OYQ36717.1 hypothetical protein CHU92_09320 [Flavobacterium cyanobacteriorum]
MNAKQLEQWILGNYQGVIVTDAYRERSFFYNPDGSLPKGIYFATIKESDGPNDKTSNLDREGIYRLSLGVEKKQYQKLFGEIPKRPAKGEIVELDFDFTTTGMLMPHPIYAWLGWVCINNPDSENLDFLKHLFDISYQNVLVKFAKKK